MDSEGDALGYLQRSMEFRHPKFLSLPALGSVYLLWLQPAAELGEGLWFCSSFLGLLLSTHSPHVHLMSFSFIHSFIRMCTLTYTLTYLLLSLLVCIFCPIPLIFPHIHLGVATLEIDYSQYLGYHSCIFSLPAHWWILYSSLPLVRWMSGEALASHPDWPLII